MNAFLALAGHAAHRAGGARVAWFAAIAALLAAVAGARLPAAEAADHALMATGLGLAVTGAVAGIGVALGAATALSPSPQLAPLAAAPVSRGLLALATLAGIAAAIAGAAAAGTAGTLAGTAVAASLRRPMERWAPPLSVEGAPRKGQALWTDGPERSLRVALLDDHPGGELTVRLRPRLRLSAAEASPFTALPSDPVQLLAPGPLGPRAVPLSGDAWAKGRLTATFTVPAGPVLLLVRSPHAGVRVGLGAGEIGVRRPDAPLGGVVIRAWAGLVPPLVLIALMAGFTSAFCSRGVAAATGLATALSLGMAPITRAALTELGRVEGLAAAVSPIAAAILALIPDPAGGLEALLSGQDLPWGAVARSAAAHLPWAALLACGGWLAVRGRDW